MRVNTIVCKRTLAVRKCFTLQDGRSITIVKQILSSKLTHWIASYIDNSTEEVQMARGVGVKLNDAILHLRSEIKSAQLESVAYRNYH